MSRAPQIHPPEHFVARYGVHRVAYTDEIPAFFGKEYATATVHVLLGKNTDRRVQSTTHYTRALTPWHKHLHSPRSNQPTTNEPPPPVRAAPMA